MTGQPTTGAVVRTEELRAVLEQELGAFFDRPVRIVDLARYPAAYRTSFALEEVDVRLQDGSRLKLMFKSMSRGDLDNRALRAKPDFLHHPMREIETYRSILTSNGLSTATCYGTVVEPHLNRYWLFLEYVPGWQLFEVEASLWPHAARWLARMHGHFALETDLTAQAEAAHLLRYDADYYRMWSQRALAFAAFDGLDGRQTQNALKRIDQRYDELVDRLMTLPRTFIHGEFFASNVLLDTETDEPRVCPVDWEMAAIGPAVIDLAALTAGGWSPQEQLELALCYRAALPESQTWASNLDTFLESLDWGRLHVAMQWLGWSPDWSPPPEHAQNWLREVLRLAELHGLLD